jgi:hypothetical protein
LLQAALCEVIAQCAKRPHMLSVLTEEGVLEALAHLTATKVSHLRTAVATAISHCCATEPNR